jgi:hypothetical protein
MDMNHRESFIFLIRKRYVNVSPDRYTVWQMVEKVTLSIANTCTFLLYLQKIFRVLTLFCHHSNGAEPQVHRAPRSCHKRFNSEKDAAIFIQEYRMIRYYVDSGDYDGLASLMENLASLGSP